MKITKLIMVLVLLSIVPCMSYADGYGQRHSDQMCKKNVAYGKPVAASGTFFELGWGDGYVVDYSIVTDGVFMNPGHRWDRGAVWWQESVDNVKNALIVYLGKVQEVSKIVLQSDTNELYKVSWEDVRYGYQSVVVSPIQAPGLSYPTPVMIDAKTDTFRIEHDSGGDDYFSVSEFQACRKSSRK